MTMQGANQTVYDSQSTMADNIPVCWQYHSRWDVADNDADLKTRNIDDDIKDDLDHSYDSDSKSHNANDAFLIVHTERVLQR